MYWNCEQVFGKTPQELDMPRQNVLEVRDASVFTHVTER